MKVTDLKGKAVVSLADGTRIGNVNEAVIDGQGLALTGLMLKGDHGDGMLPMSAIRANGHDAITVDSTAAVQWNTDLTRTGGQALHDFLDLTVVDSAGTVLGHIHDVTVADDGHIESISLREGGVLGIGAHEHVIPAAQIHAVGPKIVTVDAAVQ